MVPLFSLPLVFLAISIVLLFCWQAALIAIWASPFVAFVYCGVFIAAVSIILLICLVAFTRLHLFSEAVKASEHPAPGQVHGEYPAPVQVHGVYPAPGQVHGEYHAPPAGQVHHVEAAQVELVR